LGTFPIPRAIGYGNEADFSSVFPTSSEVGIVNSFQPLEDVLRPPLPLSSTRVSWSLRRTMHGHCTTFYQQFYRTNCAGVRNADASLFTSSGKASLSLYCSLSFELIAFPRTACCPFSFTKGTSTVQLYYEDQQPPPQELPRRSCQESRQEVIREEEEGRSGHHYCWCDRAATSEWVWQRLCNPS